MDGSQILLSPDQIAARAKGVGLTIFALCQAAEVSDSIFYRWRARRFMIGTRAYQRLVHALLTAERGNKGIPK